MHDNDNKHFVKSSQRHKLNRVQLEQQYKTILKVTVAKNRILYPKITNSWRKMYYQTQLNLSWYHCSLHSSYSLGINHIIFFLENWVNNFLLLLILTFLKWGDLSGGLTLRAVCLHLHRVLNSEEAYLYRDSLQSQECSLSELLTGMQTKNMFQRHKFRILQPIVTAIN